MTQYLGIKAKYPDAMLLFRVGDFYETFGADAIKMAEIVGIVLTKRANGSSHIELAGFPHHSLDTYLPKLVRAGQRVAICDQLEDPKTTKKIVKRGVTELVTPGVALNDQILDNRSNNFLAAVHIVKSEAGAAFLDVSTGEFHVAQGSIQYIDKLLQSFQPSEILYQRQHQKTFETTFGAGYYTYMLEDWVFTEEFGFELLLKHFSTNSMKGFGVDQQPLSVIAAGAALHYLRETQHDKVEHINRLSRIEEDNHVWLDRFTIRNLELFFSPNENAITLIDILDRTTSPMGSRLLKRWLALPLKDAEPIRSRHETVKHFTENTELADDLISELAGVGDLERLVSKISTARIAPRELKQLGRSLAAMEPIKARCEAADSTVLQELGKRIDLCSAALLRIQNELTDDPPVQVAKGNVMATGISQELDELRAISYSGKDFLAQMQARESERTGIPSLKIGFNNVFGYYLEVTNAHKGKVPEEWHRKQTLVNAERYITGELKEYEEKILGAEEKILALETRLYNALVLALADYIVPIQQNAALLARLDCLLSFATVARKNSYVCPEMTEGTELDIIAGRHPVIERQLPVGESYIDNDVFLDSEKQQIIMITGPNMSGKSALLRQTALIVLMAQIGSFVPATTAKIGIVDKVFTRVGASDNISMGESTFMVEMNETASILNNLSSRSLILLDEIGRGTSTYDGISIAWAIAEFLHGSKTRPKTLFATHYHELNEMSQSFERIRNYNVSVKEINNKVIFLRKLIPGGSEHSFGIHVARMAGMPKAVLNRANTILKQLEQNSSNPETKASRPVPKAVPQEDYQLSFFQLDDPVLSQIKEDILAIDIDTLTPVEALLKLNEIKRIIGG